MKNKILCSIITGILLTVTSTTAFAGTWEKGTSTFGKYGWLYKQDNGAYIKNGWVYDNGAWYHFSLGIMEAGRTIKGSSGDPYDYYIDSDGKMVTGGFYDIKEYRETMGFTDKQGHLIKGLFMVDNVLYESSDLDGLFNKTYYGSSFAMYINTNNQKVYIKDIINGGKVLKEDGTQFSSDDELFSKVKYLPKYDSKGNFLGAIQN